LFCLGLGLGLAITGLGLGLGLARSGLGLGLGLASTGLGLGLGLARSGLGLGLGLPTAGLDYKTDLSYLQAQCCNTICVANCTLYSIHNTVDLAVE